MELDGCENENGRRMKESMNEIGLQILNCVWDGLNEATWYTEEKKFTLDYVGMVVRGLKKVVMVMGKHKKKKKAQKNCMIMYVFITLHVEFGDILKWYIS